MPPAAQEFTVEDVEYLRHGDNALVARFYRPRGAGPFPLVVELHGGAWATGDLTECEPRAEVLARAGLFVASLNFRHAGDGYLAAMADINYAIRWLKARGAQLGVRADRVGLSGQSSGGHLAMLAAMRPTDPRYTAIPLPAGSPAVDATVRCVAMSWPVINPLSRYRHALRARSAPTPAAWVGAIPERQELFWKDEATMAEGNPVLALERGEHVVTPPALWVQGRPDVLHDYRDPESPFDGPEPERFAAAYRRAGGHLDLLYIEQAQRMTAASFDPIAAYLLRQLA
jgi:acetyl esterase